MNTNKPLKFKYVHILNFDEHKEMQRKRLLRDKYVNDKFKELEDKNIEISVEIEKINATLLNNIQNIDKLKKFNNKSSICECIVFSAVLIIGISIIITMLTFMIVLVFTGKIE